MGLLDRFMGTHKVDPQEEKVVRALIAVPMLIATSDSKLDVSEMDQMVQICFSTPLLKDRVLDENYAVTQDILNVIKTDGQQVVWEETKANLPSYLYDTALRCAVKMASADGKVSEAEFETLKLMAQCFQMTQDQFMTLYNEAQTLEHVKRPVVH